LLFLQLLLFPFVGKSSFSLFAIGLTISGLLLATTYNLPFLLFVANPSASVLALEAAPAQVLQEQLATQLLEEELPAL
jgi:hypothetical protein